MGDLLVRPSHSRFAPRPPHLADRRLLLDSAARHPGRPRARAHAGLPPLRTARHLPVLHSRPDRHRHVRRDHPDQGADHLAQGALRRRRGGTARRVRRRPSRRRLGNRGFADRRPAAGRGLPRVQRADPLPPRRTDRLSGHRPRSRPRPVADRDGRMVRALRDGVEPPPARPARRRARALRGRRTPAAAHRRRPLRGPRGDDLLLDRMGSLGRHRARHGDRPSPDGGSRRAARPETARARRDLSPRLRALLHAHADPDRERASPDRSDPDVPARRESLESRGTSRESVAPRLETRNSRLATRDPRLVPTGPSPPRRPARHRRPERGRGRGGGRNPPPLS